MIIVSMKFKLIIKIVRSTMLPKASKQEELLQMLNEQLPVMLSLV